MVGRGKVRMWSVQQVGVRHPEGVEHAALHHLGDRRALDPGDDLADQSETVIGVRPLGARRHVQRQPLGEQAEQIVVGMIRPERLVRTPGVGRRRHLADAGRVGEQVAQRHGLGVSVDGQLRNVVNQPVVEAEAAFVHERHGAKPDHRLGDGADALTKPRTLGPAALDVGEAEALGEHQVRTFHHADGKAGRPQFLEGLAGNAP